MQTKILLCTGQRNFCTHIAGKPRLNRFGRPAKGGLSLAWALLAALTACFVEAKPNKDALHGCTPKQIRADEAKACIEQLRADILAGKPDTQVHYLLCKGRAMYCCTGGDGTPRDCEFVGEARRIGPATQPDATVRAIQPADDPGRTLGPGSQPTVR